MTAEDATSASFADIVADAANGALRDLCATGRPVGVAVSGGSDSVALLVALAQWGKQHNVTIVAATVNHGLRAEAAKEAATVVALCDTLGVEHITINLSGLDTGANLQSRARDARYRVLAGWARQHDLCAVTVGHTADDVAETLMMRLARGAGVTGLAQMQDQWQAHGVQWVRPLLNQRRCDLQNTLTAHGIGWATDPSNDDPAFQRARARKALAQLADTGVTVDGLARTARLLRQAEDTLDGLARDAAAGLVTERAGALAFETARMASNPPEIQRRIRLAAIRWLTAQPYAPRRDEQERLAQAGAAGRKHTLAGCLFLSRDDTAYICREPRAVAGPCPTDQCWDGRWKLDGPHRDDLYVAALGPAGVAALKDWRTLDLPREVLLTTPAIWRRDGPGDQLIAAPVIENNSGWTARIVADFSSSVLSH